MVENYVGMGGRRTTESRRNIQYMTGKRADERDRAMQYAVGKRTDEQVRNMHYTAGQKTVRQRSNRPYTERQRTVRQEKELQYMRCSTAGQKVSGRNGAGEKTKGTRKMSAIRRRNRRIKRFCTVAAGIVLCLGIVAAIQGVQEAMAGFSMGLPGRLGNGQILDGEEVPLIAGTQDFSEELQELLEKNEETRDYVENYPNRTQYSNQVIDLTEDFTAGEIPLLMQWDKRWGYNAYGDSMIGLAGCGPLCLNMAYLYFTEDLTMTPRKMAEFVQDGGYHTAEGTSWSLWTEGVSKLGLEGSELSLDENVMQRALDTGGLIVCSMRPGDFTTTGHFILIRGYGKDGFYVNDPNRRSTSGKVWSFDALRSQIKNLWVLRKEL